MLYQPAGSARSLSLAPDADGTGDQATISTEQRASSVEWALDRSGSANGHLTSPRNGHLTFRKTAVGDPPLKHGTLGSGQAVRRLTLDQEIEGSNPSSPAMIPDYFMLNSFLLSAKS